MKKAGLQVPGLAWGIVIVSLFTAVGLVRSIISHYQKLDIVKERRVALEEVTRKNNELAQKLKEATSPAFIEHEARVKLGLVKEGDTVVLMDRPGDAFAGRMHQGSPSESIWKQWWSIFF